MEPVASDALGVEVLRNCVMIGDGTVAVMERGVEAGDLKQLGTTLRSSVRIGARLLG